jgi:hypothetical protein
MGSARRDPQIIFALSFEAVNWLVTLMYRPIVLRMDAEPDGCIPY